MNDSTMGASPKSPAEPPGECAEQFDKWNTTKDTHLRHNRWIAWQAAWNAGRMNYYYQVVAKLELKSVDLYGALWHVLNEVPLPGKILKDARDAISSYTELPCAMGSCTPELEAIEAVFAELRMRDWNCEIETNCHGTSVRLTHPSGSWVHKESQDGSKTAAEVIATAAKNVLSRIEAEATS